MKHIALLMALSFSTHAVANPRHTKPYPRMGGWQQTTTETITDRRNIFCVCEYGIHDVARAGEPMKGYWLRQVQVKDDGSVQELLLKNYGSDERSCNAAVSEHTACNVGVITYSRSTRK